MIWTAIAWIGDCLQLIFILGSIALLVWVVGATIWYGMIKKDEPLKEHMKGEYDDECKKEDNPYL